ncbi:helix-turn-helix domain-containing protein [Nonomuraea africana]|nr:helix-turn-helix domain-containing protein [Nonomuraea africana]
MTPEQVQHARDLLTRPENTVSSIARLLGVSRSTITSTCPNSRWAALPSNSQRRGPNWRREADSPDHRLLGGWWHVGSLHPVLWSR